MSSRINAELLSGLLFIVVGSLFLIGSFDLNFGTWRKIGPAGFPAIVATGLIIMGGIVVLKARAAGATGESLQFSLPKLAVIIASVLIFGITVRGAGLLVAVALCSLVASFASRPLRIRAMALYGLFMGAACSLVFITGLGMPVRIIGPWFGF